MVVRPCCMSVVSVVVCLSRGVCVATLPSEVAADRSVGFVRYWLFITLNSELLADLQALEQREEERVARGQQARERRAARALAARLASTRCGSCATCTQLIMFGAQTNWKSFSGGPRKCLVA